MHIRNKHNCIILKDGVIDPGLAFAGKGCLGPFWTWVQVSSCVHVLQPFVGTFVSSFRHERTSTGGTIYTEMQMQDLFDGLQFNYPQTIIDNKGCISWELSPR
jgi:hypothetical protein